MAAYRIEFEKDDGGRNVSQQGWPNRADAEKACAKMRGIGYVCRVVGGDGRHPRRFQLGRLAMTRGVNNWCAESADACKGVLRALRRHARADWGEVSVGDGHANDQALEDGARVLSAYTFADRKVWVITEADRSATTVLFPEEY